MFVDQQLQIRRADRKNGVWYLTVDQAGSYEIELRRWPRQSNARLDQGMPELAVTDGLFIEGAALPIASATLELNGRSFAAQPNPENTCCSFVVDLKPGPLEMKGTFIDGEGKPVRGAYYAYVNRK